MAACEKERKTNAAQSWQEMSDKKKWLHWEEILEVVKKQRLAFESAQPGLPVAQESVRYLALLFYTCLPVARSKEYRLLTYQTCLDENLKKSVPTPTNKDTNVLFISETASSMGLYFGAYKTKSSLGPQKILLQTEHALLMDHIIEYLYKQRSVLRDQPGGSQGEESFLFLVSYLI